MTLCMHEEVQEHLLWGKATSSKVVEKEEDIITRDISKRKETGSTPLGDRRKEGWKRRIKPMTDERNCAPAKDLLIDAEPSNILDQRQEGTGLEWDWEGKGTGKNWNSLFQEALELPEDSYDQCRLKWERLTTINQDFVSTAVTYGKIIISEYFLPSKEKSLKPTHVGGVAGGTKYIWRGILFKLADGKSGPYGGSMEAAAKGAGHDMRGATHYLASRVRGLHYALQCLIDYKGFRMTAQALLPVDATTLRYGTADAANTVYNEDKALSALLKDAARKLNLQVHNVKGKKMYSACDIEGHLGHDKRYYLLDFARSFPPESPCEATHLLELMTDGTPVYVAVDNASSTALSEKASNSTFPSCHSADRCRKGHCPCRSNFQGKLVEQPHEQNLAVQGSEEKSGIMSENRGEVEGMTNVGVGLKNVESGWGGLRLGEEVFEQSSKIRSGAITKLGIWEGERLSGGADSTLFGQGLQRGTGRWGDMGVASGDKEVNKKCRRIRGIVVRPLLDLSKDCPLTMGDVSYEIELEDGRLVTLPSIDVTDRRLCIYWRMLRPEFVKNTGVAAVQEGGVSTNTYSSFAGSTGDSRGRSVQGVGYEERQEMRLGMVNHSSHNFGFSDGYSGFSDVIIDAREHEAVTHSGTGISNDFKEMTPDHTPRGWGSIGSAGLFVPDEKYQAFFCYSLKLRAETTSSSPSHFGADLAQGRSQSNTGGIFHRNLPPPGPSYASRQVSTSRFPLSKFSNMSPGHALSTKMWMSAPLPSPNLPGRPPLAPTPPRARAPARGDGRTYGTVGEGVQGIVSGEIEGCWVSKIHQANSERENIKLSQSAFASAPTTNSEATGGGRRQDDLAYDALSQNDESISPRSMMSQPMPLAKRKSSVVTLEAAAAGTKPLVLTFSGPLSQVERALSAVSLEKGTSRSSFHFYPPSNSDGESGVKMGLSTEGSRGPEELRALFARTSVIKNRRINTQNVRKIKSSLKALPARVTALSPDALSGFSKTDKDYADRNNEVHHATRVLVEKVIPTLVEHLSRLPSSIQENICLAVELHRYGVNVRHLGFMRSLLDNSKGNHILREVILTEMVARTLKNILRSFQRKWMEAECSTSEQGMRHLVVNFLNLVTGAHSNSESFWREQVAVGLLQRFGIRALTPWERERLQRLCASPCILKKCVHKLTEMQGIDLTPMVDEQFRSVPNPSMFRFIVTDIKEIRATVRYMHILDYGQGILLSMQAERIAAQGNKDPRTVSRLEQMAEQYFMTAHKSLPDDLNTMLELRKSVDTVRMLLGQSNDSILTTPFPDFIEHDPSAGRMKVIHPEAKGHQWLENKGQVMRKAYLFVKDLLVLRHFSQAAQVYPLREHQNVLVNSEQNISPKCWPMLRSWFKPEETWDAQDEKSSWSNANDNPGDGELMA